MRSSLIIFTIVLQTLIFAADGDLDLHFGTNGKVVTNMGSPAWIRSVAIQSDDKIIAVGRSWNAVNDNSDFALSRYNNDGSLDMTFANTGKVFTDITGYDRNDSAYSVAIQSDGKILVAGYSHMLGDYDYDFVLVRYDSDGNLAAAFGSGGKVIQDVGGTYSGGNYYSDDRAYSVAIQSDGKILVAGSSYANLVLFRYDSDGNLDASFGSNGKVIKNRGCGSSYDVANIGIQSDNKIVVQVVGYHGNCIESYYFLYRYDSDGNLDASFGSGGYAFTDVDFGSATSVSIQSDDKILMAGGFDSNFVLVRYDKNGILDGTFNTYGKVYTDLGGNCGAEAYSIAIQSNGKIVLAGRRSDNSGEDFALVRYNGNGTPDTSFGNNGIVITDVRENTSKDRAYSVAIQSDHKIVVGGESENSDPGKDFALARYQGKSLTLAPIYYLLQ